MIITLLYLLPCLSDHVTSDLYASYEYSSMNSRSLASRDKYVQGANVIALRPHRRMIREQKL